MVIVGIEPFARIIPHLMTSLGIWNRTSVDRDKYPLSLTVLVANNILHQQNGYICDLFLFTNFLLHLIVSLLICYVVTLFSIMIISSL